MGVSDYREFSKRRHNPGHWMPIDPKEKDKSAKNRDPKNDSYSYPCACTKPK